jgi:hypothetical protein
VFAIAEQMVTTLQDVAANSERNLNSEIVEIQDTLTAVCCRELARHTNRKHHTGETYRLTCWDDLAKYKEGG